MVCLEQNIGLRIRAESKKVWRYVSYHQMDSSSTLLIFLFIYLPQRFQKNRKLIFKNLFFLNFNYRISVTPFKPEACIVTRMSGKSG